jgi:hypothetical protein
MKKRLGWLDRLLEGSRGGAYREGAARSQWPRSSRGAVQGGQSEAEREALKNGFF